ncbi:retropepsin-like domain-containing protein [Alteromonas ponticola]|uniref:Retropepsin-like domain-containing protein n=1 Tax=Alteromonas aquimaris TaxID=2998417 RepID=A0ABT3PAP5_9ALTE|nr:retropepsin-like aspartic protease [Alteromonas aquimaris]MCW8109853.1 retropepsin-like domain-containing protein [Alteromonas aquimaris]
MPINAVFAQHISQEAIAGIVGQDAVVSLNALIDLSSAQLVIPETEHDTHAFLTETLSTDFTSVELHESRMGFHFVEVTLNNQPARLIIDSGAPQVMLDKSELERMALKTEQHDTAKMVLNDGTKVAIDVLHDTSIAIGDTIIEGELMASDLSGLMTAINEKAETRIIGVIGNQQLVKLKSIIDLSQSTLHLSSPYSR